MKKNLLNFASAICFWIAAYYKRGEPFNQGIFSLDWFAIFGLITLGVIIKEYNEFTS